MHAVRLGLFLTLLGLAAALIAAPPTASWEGLTGLYMQPTAEILPEGSLALTFSELRFPQHANGIKLRNIWYSGSVTVPLASRWELALSRRHELIDLYEDGVVTDRFNDHLYPADVKYVLSTPSDDRIGLAVGILDITDTTNDVQGYPAERGRRFFAVASRRWVHLGVSHDEGGLGAFAGTRLAVGEHTDLIAEWTSAPLFAQLLSEPSNNTNFNIGFRFYPLETPDMRIDLAAIGDGEFDFGFSFSYNFR